MSLKVSRRTKGIGAIILVIGTVILSWIGLGIFVPEINKIENLPHRIYRVVKIAMGGDPTEGANPADNVPWQLMIVKIFVVIILIVTVFKIIQKVFHEQYTMLRMLFKKGHTIVCGIDSKGLQTLRDHDKSWGKKAVGVEVKHESEKAKTARKEGHAIIWGDVKEDETLLEAGVTKASNLICFLPGEQNGIEVLSTVYDIYEKKKPNNKLNCYLQLNNARLIEVIERAEQLSHFKDEGIDVRFFNFDKMIARHLFHSFAKHHFTDIIQLKSGKFFRFLIFGLGDSGKALLLQALRIMHFDSTRKTEIVIADRNIDTKKKKFEETYSFVQNIFPVEFEEYDGTYQQLISKYTSRDENAIPVVIAAMESNDDNLALGLEVLQYTPEENFKIYTKNSDSKNLSSLLKKTGDAKGRMIFFGDLETFCKMEYITGKEQDRLAEIIHNDYLKQQQETVASESERYKTPWEDLPEDARDANRAQADHLILKLAQAGIKFDETRQDFKLNDEQTEALAIAEHDRWCAHRYINGWQFGEARNDVKKLHPSLVSWEALNEGEKQKDRDAVLRIPLLLNEQALFRKNSSVKT